MWYFLIKATEIKIIKKTYVFTQTVLNVSNWMINKGVRILPWDGDAGVREEGNG